MMTGLGTIFIKKNFLTLLVIAMYKISFSKVYRVIFQNKDDKKLFINLGAIKVFLTFFELHLWQFK